MSDWLKMFREMSLDNFLLIVGLALFGIAVALSFSFKIGLSQRARVISAVVGVCFALTGFWIHRGHSTSPGAFAPPQSTTVTTPMKEVHVQEGPTLHQVADDHSTNHSHPVSLSYFSGTWRNTDAKTRGFTTLNVRTSGESVWVHAWAACHPSDCDWGEVAGTPLSSSVSNSSTNDAEKVTAVFETSFSNTLLTLSPADDDELQADTQTNFTDNSGRSGYSATYTFRH